MTVHRDYDARPLNPFQAWFTRITASLGGAGYSPVAPGTAGTLVGLLAVFAIGPSRWSGWFFVSIAAVYAVGVVSSTWAERLWRRSDPGYVCIDEFAGYLVSIACVPAANEPLLLVAAFFLFRVFDIIKPPPARMAERGPSGWGIMNDDIVAGLYTNLVLQVASRLGWV